MSTRTPPKPFRPPAISPERLDVIRQRIAHHRERAGLSQYALAQAAGLSLSAVSLVERGANGVALGTLFALADALGIRVGKLVE